MGIRINKAIGWGLPGLKQDDPRVNPDFDPYEIPSIEEFVKFCDEKMAFASDRHVRMRDRLQSYTSAHFCVRDGRTGADYNGGVFFDDGDGGPYGVMLIVPYGQKSWHRRDDIIDYVEDSYVREGWENGPDAFTSILPAGIYPYMASWMDSRTGRVVEHVPCILDVLKSLHGWTSDTPLSMCPGLEFWAADGNGWDAFKNIGEVRRFLAPKVPWDVTAMCRFLNIFKSDNTILQLRPMLCRWWS